MAVIIIINDRMEEHYISENFNNWEHLISTRQSLARLRLFGFWYIDIFSM